MSDYTFWFGITALACGMIALGCAAAIYIEEDISERTYGNGKESGFKNQSGERLPGRHLDDA